MSDVQVGRVFRGVRVKLARRQEDVAAPAGVSRQVVSRIERGRFDEVSVTALRKVADELEIHLDTVARWRGGELDRLLNRRHNALHEVALGLFARHPAWQVVPELSFNVWGERGVIDIAAWHPERRALAIDELKSEFVDPADVVRTMDRRQRLAMDIARSRGWSPLRIGCWVIAADTRTNRRQLAASRRLLRGAFPADGRALARWLRDPAESMSGLAFLPVPAISGNGMRVRGAARDRHDVGS